MLREKDLTRGLAGFTFEHCFNEKKFIIRVVSVKSILSRSAVVVRIKLNDINSQCLCSINERVLDPYLKIRKGSLVLKNNKNNYGEPDLQIDVAEIGESVLLSI